MIEAYGLDLGGMSQGNSALARAERGARGTKVTIYTGHAFLKKPSEKALLRDIVAVEKKVLEECMEHAPLYVDVPIDLQGLPCPGKEVYPWQLVQRPADRAFGALRPLADRIGSVVARFINLHRALGSCYVVGEQVMETYPAASLELLGLPRKSYKRGGHIEREDGHWKGSGVSGTVLSEIASGLGLVAEKGVMLDHDELDAAICALSGVAEAEHKLQGDELEAEIENRLGVVSVDCSAPEGYVLIRSQPEKMTVLVEKKHLPGPVSLVGSQVGCCSS